MAPASEDRQDRAFGNLAAMMSANDAAVSDEDIRLVRSNASPVFSVTAGGATCGINLEQRRGSTAATAHGAALNVTSLRVHPRADERPTAISTLATCRALQGEIPPRSASDAECEALDRRDADAQARERTGAGCDGKRIDVRRADTLPVEERENFTRQPLAVRARRVTRRSSTTPSSSTAPRRRRGSMCQSQHTHQ
jgi:hypothetical protein